MKGYQVGMFEDKTEFHCLYNCGMNSPSTEKYHILPFSASEMEIVLPTGMVCDKCNRYFGRELENYFCHHHPGVALKPFGVKLTTQGIPPKAFLENGQVTVIDLPDENSRRISTPLVDLNMTLDSRKKMEIRGHIVSKSFKSRLVSRTLAKIALELVHGCDEFTFKTNTSEFDRYKKYIRFGQGDFVCFAFCVHGVSIKQSRPWVKVMEESGCIRSGVVNISLPGILYQIPIPPISPIGKFVPSVDSKWVICDEDRLYEAYNVPVEVTFSNPD